MSVKSNFLVLFLGNSGQNLKTGTVKVYCKQKITKFQTFHFHLFWAKDFLKADSLFQI